MCRQAAGDGLADVVEGLMILTVDCVGVDVGWRSLARRSAGAAAIPPAAARRRGASGTASQGPLPLLAREHGSQKPEFSFHFRGIGHGIRDFLAKEFAIPLAKPVNRNFERPL